MIKRHGMIKSKPEYMATNPAYIKIPSSLLKLDLNNPRLPKSLRDKGAGEEEIIEYMLLDASLIELMMAIGENNFFPGEPLLVVKEGNNYKAVEGNRRLGAVKLLSNPALAKAQKEKVQRAYEEAKFRPDEIPCLVFGEDRKIRNYFGHRHITGVKEWKLLEKARYLSGLRKNNFSNLNLAQASREIAKIIGSRADYVQRILVGFELYKHIEEEAFFRIRDLNDTTFYFNYIADSLNRANISSFLGIDFNAEVPESAINIVNLKKWTQWLFEKNDQNKTRLIGDSGDLDSLHAILGHEKARIAFDEKGYSLEKAKELADESDNQFQAFIKRAADPFANADREDARIKLLYEDDLKEIRQRAQKILKTIQENEDVDDN